MSVWEHKGPLRWARLALIALAGGAALLIVTVATLAETMRDRPVRVLSITPGNVAATANWASRALSAQKEEAVPRAMEMAKQALQRDPTSIDAWRVLALAADAQGRSRLARRRFAVVERLTRRDQMTHQWLISYQLARGEIEALVGQIDLALRTSERNSNLFLPVLVNATAEDRALEPILARLAATPNWRDSFMAHLVASAPDLKNAARIAYDLDPDVPAEREWLRILLYRMATAGEYSLAWSLYSHTRDLGLDAPPWRVHDGTFDGEGEYPFGWQLLDERELNAQRGARDGDNGNSLLLTALDGRSGSVARQLLALGPGDFALSARIGGFPDERRGRPELVLSCAGAARTLGRLVPQGNAVPGGQVYSTVVRVPRGCSWQWLSVEISGSDRDTFHVPWVDDVAARPLGAADGG